MEAPAPQPGISTASVRSPPDLVASSSSLTAPPPAWPRSAQAAAAGLLAVSLALMGWHVWTLQRGATRPMVLEAGPSIDLNEADLAQLQQLPGTGPALAKRIDTYRREHNGFRRIDELLQVPGIGPALLERLRPLVHVEPTDSPADEEEPPPRKRSPGRSGKKTPPNEPLDINEASLTELQQLPRIGPQLAQRIVAARKERPFRAVDDLRRVPGIGVKTLQQLRPHVCVHPSASGQLADRRPTLP